MPENCMVAAARQAMEAMYRGRCTVTEHQQYQEGGRTKYREVVVLRDQPCRLSFSSAPAAGAADPVAPLLQTVKLFLPPNIEVQSDSKITVTQNGITTDYRGSGVPMRYGTHQEIMLELFWGWT